MALQYTQKSSYTLETSFHAPKTEAFSNLYLETEDLSPTDINVFTVQQTENSTTENNTVSSDTEEKIQHAIEELIYNSLYCI